MVNGRRSPDARREACAESGKSPRDQGCEESSPTPSSRATGRGQRDVLEPLTTSEATVFPRGTIITLYLGPDRFDLRFATKELAKDNEHQARFR